MMIGIAIIIAVLILAFAFYQMGKHDGSIAGYLEAIEDMERKETGR